MREFRAHCADYQTHGLAVAGISRDTPESNRRWAERLHLPYPLVSDTEAAAGNAFGVVRRIGIGDWKIEFFRRSTFLVDRHGVVVAVWGSVKIRGHALQVLEVAEALARMER